MKAAELAEMLGVPPRQIRYMIAEGIIPGATGLGRSADGFGEAHLAAARRFFDLKAEGHSTFEAKRLMASERLVVLFERHPLSLSVDPHVDPGTIDVEAVLSDIASALRSYVNPNQE